MIHIQKLHDPQIEVHDSMIEAHGAVSSDRFHELCSSWRNTRDYSHGGIAHKARGRIPKDIDYSGAKNGRKFAAENSCGKRKKPVDKLPAQSYTIEADRRQEKNCFCEEFSGTIFYMAR